MTRYAYVTKPRSWWSDEPALADVSTRTVIMDDDEPERTGLLDQHGTPIYRVRERIPFGFVKG